MLLSVANKSVAIFFSTAITIGGAILVSYGMFALEQLFTVRLTICLGIVALLAGSLGFQLIWWADHKDDGAERRKRPRYPKDHGPGPSGRHTRQ